MALRFDPQYPELRLLAVALILSTGCSEEKTFALLHYSDGHDPARIVRDEGILLHYFSGIEFNYYDAAEAQWKPGLEEQCDGDYCILRDENKPTWIEESMDGRDVSVGAAPGMLDSRTMYYTVADWQGDDGSACIGLARATGSAPFLDWQDVGEPVVCSTPESVQEGGPFAIDAAPFVDADGRQWMVFGSHYSGIWGVELDVESGLQLEDAPVHLLATGPPGEESTETEQSGGAIEAAYMHERDGLYTLFVNWYACCMGIESTYEIRVGISDSPMGPFLDRQGVRMDEGGGTLLLEADGRFIGPGHAGIYLHTDGREVFSFHFYDLQGEEQGGSLAMRLMEWDTDGWPEVLEQNFIP